MARTTSPHRESLPSKARRLLEDGRVSSVGCASAWDVEGDHGTTWRVVLGDQWAMCGCPAQREQCSHVLAAMAALDELGDERAVVHVLRSSAPRDPALAA